MGEKEKDRKRLWVKLCRSEEFGFADLQIGEEFADLCLIKSKAMNQLLQLGVKFFKKR